MPKLTLIAALTFLVLMVSMPGAQDEQNPAQFLGPISPRTGLLLTDNATIKLINTSSGDLAHDYVSRIALWDRTRMTQGYRKAAEWVAQKAEEFGLEEVTIESFPSGGGVQYFGNRTEPYWEVKRGELWMKEPYSIKLTSFKELPLSLCKHSASVHLETELVDIGTGLLETDYKTDIKGKIVLTSSAPEHIIQRAVDEKGAAGILSYFVSPFWDYANRQPGEFPSQVGWATLRGSEIVPKEKSGGEVPPEKETFAFLISTQRANELKQLMLQGETIRLRVDVDSENRPGTLDIVNGIIKGSKYPAEEIVLAAHLDHYKPGANDNASGSAILLEMIRVLNHMIEAREIPEPLRTIRFMWMPEYIGTWAWFSKHHSDPVKRIAALNYDGSGADLIKTHGVFIMMYTPDAMPSFLNAVMESILDFMNANNNVRYPAQKDFHIISLTGSRNRLHGEMAQFNMGSDHEVFNNLKIPGGMVGAGPDDFYHSQEDNPDKVDATQLHRAVFSGLAALLTIAYADDENAVDMAQLSLIYGKKRIGMEGETRAARLVATLTAEDVEEKERLIPKIITHVYQREQAAILSTKIFARTSKTRETIEQTALLLESAERLSLQNIAKSMELQAAALNKTPRKYVLSTVEKEAARLFPQRNTTHPLEGTTYVYEKLNGDSDLKALQKGLEQVGDNLKKKGESVLLLFALRDAPSFYADGTRSILEIRDAIAVEYTWLPAELMNLYFRVFEKAGVVTIRQYKKS